MGAKAATCSPRRPLAHLRLRCPRSPRLVFDLLPRKTAEALMIERPLANHRPRSAAGLYNPVVLPPHNSTGGGGGRGGERSPCWLHHRCQARWGCSTSAFGSQLPQFRCQGVAPECGSLVGSPRHLVGLWKMQGDGGAQLVPFRSFQRWGKGKRRDPLSLPHESATSRPAPAVHMLGPHP